MLEIDKDRLEYAKKVKNSESLDKLAKSFHKETAELKYAYNYDWFGRPIIQLPQDVVIMQEIIFDVKPDLIIETGVAHGGSLIFYSSMLHLLDLYESNKGNISNERSVLGIDIKIHDHNKEFIQTHPFSDKICLHESSSVCDSIKPFIDQATKGKKSILVVLDSNHTEDHVYKELNMYSQFVSPNSYCVVFDSTIEDMPEEMFSNREWGPGNNPRTAVDKFLKENSDFILDENVNNKPILTAAKGGFLKKLKV